MEEEARLDRAFAALSDPTRRAILRRLSAGPATVNELRAGAALSQPAISKHLKILERAGLVEQGRAAQFRPRRLRRDGLGPAARWVKEMGRLWDGSFDRLEAYLGVIGVEETKGEDRGDPPKRETER